MVKGQRRLTACLAGLAGIIAIEIANPYDGGGLSGNGYMAMAADLVAFFGGVAVDKFKNGAAGKDD